MITVSDNSYDTKHHTHTNAHDRVVNICSTSRVQEPRCYQATANTYYNNYVLIMSRTAIISNWYFQLEQYQFMCEQCLPLSVHLFLITIKYQKKSLAVDRLLSGVETKIHR